MKTSQSKFTFKPLPYLFRNQTGIDHCRMQVDDCKSAVKEQEVKTITNAQKIKDHDLKIEELA